MSAEGSSVKGDRGDRGDRGDVACPETLTVISPPIDHVAGLLWDFGPFVKNSHGITLHL